MKKVFREHDKKKDLICSELVYRNFAEAKPQGKYTLSVVPSFALRDDALHASISDLQQRMKGFFF